MTGGYDDGYSKCSCFWGTRPGSLVVRLLDNLGPQPTMDVLDAGCGEGKNAIQFAMRGHRVLAVDCSELALRNARVWEHPGIAWSLEDIRSTVFAPDAFDVVIAYGVFHCLETQEEIVRTITSLKMATKPGGYHVVCAFNERHQDLTAHPDLSPCLLPHCSYLSQYQDWNIVDASDTDLYETHPHNNIPHVHSLTRLIAQRRKA